MDRLPLGPGAGEDRLTGADRHFAATTLVEANATVYVASTDLGVVMHSAGRCARTLFGIIITFILLGCGLTPVVTAEGEPGTAVAAAEEAEIDRLAERAKAAFRRRMEPPPPIVITLVNILERDWTAIFRDLARDSYEAAVDALLAEARTPERARRVTAALRQLVNAGTTDLAEAI